MSFHPRRQRVTEYGTTAVAIDILRASPQPLSAVAIVAIAGERLPTRAVGAAARRNVVARDLCRELARGEAARVRRVGEGLYEAAR